MKKIYRWTILFAITATMVACEKETEKFEAPDSSSYQESFMTGYIDVDEVVLFGSSSNALLGFEFQGEEVNYNSSDPNKLARYKEFSAKYNDQSYNNQTIPNWGCGPAVSAIRVTSTIDLGTAYPAGVLLNEFITVHTTSFYPFIRNNYQRLDPTGGMEVAIEKPLNELTAEDMKLWNKTGYFTLENAPFESIREIPLRVEFDFDNGCTTSDEEVISLSTK